jgi:ribulose kinase
MINEESKKESAEEKILFFEKRVVYLEEQLSQANEKIQSYETGDRSLYYSIQRKMSEMSKMLNAQNLMSIDISSKSDATFERVFKLLEKMEAISNASTSLAKSLGLKKETETKGNFVDALAEDRN